MTLHLSMNENDELKPRITVFGVGGAGGNAVNNMIDKKLDGVEFVVANTDAQALAQSKCEARVQMGLKVTEGLGAGARSAVGAASAEESIEEIVDHLAGAHMCFITAGMGGGTGTGATPIIAKAARELGVLTVGVVTKPFLFEGSKRMRQAEEGIEILQKQVDTLIIIPNQNLFRLATESTTCTDAFGMADDVLYQGVKGVTDLMVRPGMINLDFADVRSVMDEMGKAMMGTGEAAGDDRALQAAELAIANPLLDEISLNGAKGVLINITGGQDLTLFELDEAANVIREKVDPDANIIVGSTLDGTMEGRMRVSVVATGIDVVIKPQTAPGPKRRPESPVTEASADAEPVAPREEPHLRRPDAGTAMPDKDVVDEDAHAFADWDSHRIVRSASESLAPLSVDMAAQPETPQPAPAGSPVAQSRPQPGQPTPEAVSRIAKVTRRAEEDRQPHAGTDHPEVSAQPEPAPAPGRRGFGFNSLINRMTGNHETPSRPALTPPPGRRVQPSVQRQDDFKATGDQEDMEIPAFLRRQSH